MENKSKKKDTQNYPHYVITPEFHVGQRIWWVRKDTLKDKEIYLIYDFIVDEIKIDIKKYKGEAMEDMIVIRYHDKDDMIRAGEWNCFGTKKEAEEFIRKLRG